MSALTANVALVSETAVIDFSQICVVAAAMQRQVTRDFGPIWEVNATVDAFDKLESVPIDYWPVIVRDDINQPGAAGFHTDENGQPFSLVQADDGWNLTASHEVLEMLADPFGSRTIAGSPPPQAPDPVVGFEQVLYLVEVCDPCEDNQFAYSTNGVTVSDFITPDYYNPTASPGVQYSFGGNIEGPHMVLEGGYVSFGNPVDNHWYQIMVRNGQPQLNDLGVISSTDGKSLRELVDEKVREARKSDQYRIKPGLAKAAKGLPLSTTSAARAKTLRNYIESRLK